MEGVCKANVTGFACIAVMLLIYFFPPFMFFFTRQ